jgi:hypothetical protein
LVAASLCGACSSALAVEGPTAAGPIGGTDIRSAMLPPPGLYGGTAALAADTFEFLDGHGDEIHAFRDGHLAKELVGPFLYDVPNVKVLGGSIGFGGMVPGGTQCGHLFLGEDHDCTTSMGDPYVELDWSRYFGKPRPSKFTGAYPILQGLNVLAGFGTVIPAGPFDASTPLQQALTIGTNIWDLAPTVAFTYTTAPILAEGTEISAKLFWNNYLENPRIHYQTGDQINVDFAVTEHIGRFQVGAAGFYVTQIEDDELLGVPLVPDGRQVKGLELGGIVAYDMPEYNSSMKLKAISTVFVENSVSFWGSCSPGSRNSEARG